MSGSQRAKAMEDTAKIMKEKQAAGQYLLQLLSSMRSCMCVMVLNVCYSRGEESGRSSEKVTNIMIISQ